MISGLLISSSVIRPSNRRRACRQGYALVSERLAVAIANHRYGSAAELRLADQRCGLQASSRDALANRKAAVAASSDPVSVCARQLGATQRGGDGGDGIHWKPVSMTTTEIVRWSYL